MQGEPGRPPAIFLTGPTASGKTDLALALADQLPVEIISVDSTMVYRGLDIGSAKPDAATMRRYPHHLVDIREPCETYSAAAFAVDASKIMAEIVDRGRVPLLVGGTMLYFRVLRAGLAGLPAADPSIRQALAARAEAEGWPALHAALAEVDPVTASRLHPHHSHRIQRALEVYRLTGKPLSLLLEESATVPKVIESVVDDYRVIQVAVSPRDRRTLHDRIEKRLLLMMEKGFIDEVEALRQRYASGRELPSLRAVGYRQVLDYLGGEYGYEVMLEKAAAATRQLAKRQYTWLRKWPQLHWLYTEDEVGKAEPLANIVDNCLKILQKGPIYKDTTR